MCLKKHNAEYPLTDKRLTIHGRCYDVLVQANAAGEAVPRPYTGGGWVAIEYQETGALDIRHWQVFPLAEIATDGLFFTTVPLGYGWYRLTFLLKHGKFMGGRFGPLCRGGVYDQDKCTYIFRPMIEDIVQQVDAPRLTGDIIIYVEGI